MSDAPTHHCGRFRSCGLSRRDMLASCLSGFGPERVSRHERFVNADGVLVILVVERLSGALVYQPGTATRRVEIFPP